MTRLDARLLERLDVTPLGRLVVAGVERGLCAGQVSVAGGVGLGVVLSGAHLPIRHAQAHALVRGTLETPVQEAFRRTAFPGAAVADIGANIGFFTLLASRLVGNTGSVSAIEAASGSVEALRANLQLNAADNVDVLAVAVADHCGRAAFLRVSEESWSHLADRGRHPGTVDEVEVDVQTLDALYAAGRIPAPDLRQDRRGGQRDRGAGRDAARPRRVPPRVDHRAARHQRRGRPSP